MIKKMIGYKNVHEALGNDIVLTHRVVEIKIQHKTVKNQKLNRNVRSVKGSKTGSREKKATQVLLSFISQL